MSDDTSSQSYFSGQRRVRAILITKRGTMVLVRRDSHKPGETHQYIAPGGIVRDDDPDDLVALRRELREQLGAEIHVIRHAMTLFMERWNFYLCGLISVDPSRRSEEHSEALKRGDYQIIELRLSENAIRTANIHPRALLDYLLANHQQLMPRR